MYYKCPACDRLTRFERHKRTSWQRLKTWASTFRPHSCNECGKEMSIDVHYREPKDAWFAALVVMAGGLLISAFAALLSAVS